MAQSGYILRLKEKRSQTSACRTLGGEDMEVHLTDDQKAFIRQAVQTGRYAREEDAVQDALSLWEERERRRVEILAAVDQAEASLTRGEGRRITTREETAQLADDQAARPGPPKRAKRKHPVDGVRLSPEAESELDDIWTSIARESAAASRLQTVS
jgi:putative addiction module CopG family antidote